MSDPGCRERATGDTGRPGSESESGSGPPPSSTDSICGRHVQHQPHKEYDQPPSRCNQGDVQPTGHDGWRYITDLLYGLEGLHETHGLAEKSQKESEHSELQDQAFQRLDLGRKLIGKRTGDNVAPEGQHDQTNDGDGGHERSPGCECVHGSRALMKQDGRRLIARLVLMLRRFRVIEKRISTGVVRRSTDSTGPLQHAAEPDDAFAFDGVSSVDTRRPYRHLEHRFAILAAARFSEHHGQP